MFWAIVLGVLAVVLMLGWWHDRRRRDRLKAVPPSWQDPGVSSGKTDFYLGGFQNGERGPDGRR